MDTQLDTEIVLRGVAAAPGIAIGPAYVYSKGRCKVQTSGGMSHKDECGHILIIKRFEQAAVTLSVILRCRW